MNLAPALAYFLSSMIVEWRKYANVNQLDNDMTPRQIVDYLNKHIVGQQDAKRAIAIAMVCSFMMFLPAECSLLSKVTGILILIR